MAQQQKKYYTAEEAAQVLGMTPAEVSQLRERNELRGLRDGATWKFKVEDVHGLSAQIKAGKRADEGDVLASEVELGPSASSKSGTVLGPKKGASADSDIKLGKSDIKLGGSDIQLGASDIKLGGSDIQLGASDIKLGGSDIKLGGSDVKLGDSGLKLSDSGKGAPAVDDELDMSLDEDLKVDDSQLRLSDEEDSSSSISAMPVSSPGSGPTLGKGSDVKVGRGSDPKLGKGSDPKLGAGVLDDDEVVLGGSGTGSDVSIGGDSGINLVGANDSGLSLEEPMEIASDDDDSLELGEDDMLTFSDATDGDSPTELQAEDEFLLQPEAAAADDEESDSGSQVIALDVGPGVSDTAATMVAGGGAPMTPMLDDELGGMPAMGMGLPSSAATTAPLGPTGFEPVGGMVPAGAGAGAPALPEAPYSGLNILALSFCVLLLVFCGWMTIDLMRNMWSWNQPYKLNSALMDWVLKMIGK